MADTPIERPGDLIASTLTRRRLLINAGVLAGGVMLAGPLAACGTTSTTTITGGSPKRGGTFRLGVTGGGAKDLIDGQTIITKPDQARLVAGFETLLEYDKDYKLQPGLAESVTQDAPDKWTIKLKSGITFHDGKALSADDVVYSLKRILTSKEAVSYTHLTLPTICSV